MHLMLRTVMLVGEVRLGQDRFPATSHHTCAIELLNTKNFRAEYTLEI